MRKTTLLLIMFVGIVGVQYALMGVQASYITGNIDDAIDGNYDAFYETIKSDNENGIDVFFANDDDYFALFINSTQIIDRVNLDGLFILEQDFWDQNLHLNFSDSRQQVEMSFSRTQDFTFDNQFKLILTVETGNTTADIKITVEVRPKTVTNSFEVKADMQGVFGRIIYYLFGGWFSGVIWGVGLISLWRMYLKPWVFISEDATNRSLKGIGKIISCEKAKRLEGLYLLKFKEGKKNKEFYCRENYETLSKQVADIKFMLYFEFYRDLVPMKFAVPEEKQWYREQIKPKSFRNGCVSILKELGCLIPSTHLAVWLDALYERETLKEKVTEVDYLVVDLMEDRIMTVWDCEYDLYAQDHEKRALDWKPVKRSNLNLTQITDLERHQILAPTDVAKDGAVRGLKISHEHRILERFGSLKDSLKDRASRLQIKVIYEAKMLELEYKIDQLTQLYIDTDTKYSTLQMNYMVDLKKNIAAVREKIEVNRVGLVQFGADIIGSGTIGGIPKDRAISDALIKHHDTYNDQLKTKYELEGKTKDQVVDAQKKRIEQLEKEILKKRSNDLNPGELSAMREETPTNGTN